MGLLVDVTPKKNMPKTLTKKSLAEAAESLATRDRDLARVLADGGTPPMWARRPGFVTLIRIILERLQLFHSTKLADRQAMP